MLGELEAVHSSVSFGSMFVIGIQGRFLGPHLVTKWSAGRFSMVKVLRTRVSGGFRCEIDSLIIFHHESGSMALFIVYIAEQLQD